MDEGVYSGKFTEDAGIRSIPPDMPDFMASAGGDVVILILSRLSFRDILNLSAVCKKIMNLFDSDEKINCFLVRRVYEDGQSGEYDYRYLYSLADKLRLKSLSGMDYSANLSARLTILPDMRFFRKLKKLNLSNCGIPDIARLSGLNDLESLWLSCNSILDISPLSGLKNIKNLVVTYNCIQCIPNLSGMVQLERADFSDNMISEVKKLPVSLKTLYLSNNQLTDMAFVRELVNMKLMMINSNKISDVSTIKDSPELEYLGIANNDICDLSCLSGRMPKLNVLHISNNDISDISCLRTLPKLEYVYAWGCNIPEVDIGNIKLFK